MESKKIDFGRREYARTHRLGLPNNRNMMSASALVSPAYHRLVVQAHENYLKAGVTMIVTSNYYVTPGSGSRQTKSESTRKWRVNSSL
ncbi:hypothetical protein DVH05_014679 [Phytophthora capsici]|nr:hypothetical protein DVH05_014679 [Phytophthora capsici]